MQKQALIQNLRCGMPWKCMNDKLFKLPLRRHNKKADEKRRALPFSKNSFVVPLAVGKVVNLPLSPRISPATPLAFFAILLPEPV